MTSRGHLSLKNHNVSPYSLDSTVALPVENTILVTASNDTDAREGAEMSIERETKPNGTSSRDYTETRVHTNISVRHT